MNNNVFYLTLADIKESWNSADEQNVICGTLNAEFSEDKNNFLPLTPELVVDDSEIDEYNLLAEEGAFDPARHSLRLSQTITLRNTETLFGRNGIVSDGVELGVAVLWNSVKRDLRGVLQCSYEKTEDSLVFSFNETFDKGSFDLSVELEYVLYVKSLPDGVGENHPEPGTLLGRLGKKTILILKGNGSQFPVKPCDFSRVESLKDFKDALWKIVFSCNDPVNDFFDEEKICLYLNKEHCDYPALLSEDRKNISPLYREIMAMASVVIVLKTIEAVNDHGDDWDTLTQQNCASGSVAKAVLRMIEDICKMQKDDCQDIAYLTASIGAMLMKHSRKAVGND